MNRVCIFWYNIVYFRTRWLKEFLKCTKLSCSFVTLMCSILRKKSIPWYRFFCCLILHIHLYSLYVIWNMFSIQNVYFMNMKYCFGPSLLWLFWIWTWQHPLSLFCHLICLYFIFKLFCLSCSKDFFFIK